MGCMAEGVSFDFNPCPGFLQKTWKIKVVMEHDKLAKSHGIL